MYAWLDIDTKWSVTLYWFFCHQPECIDFRLNQHWFNHSTFRLPLVSMEFGWKKLCKNGKNFSRNYIGRAVKYIRQQFQFVTFKLFIKWNHLRAYMSNLLRALSPVLRSRKVFQSFSTASKNCSIFVISNTYEHQWISLEELFSSLFEKCKQHSENNIKSAPCASICEEEQRREDIFFLADIFPKCVMRAATTASVNTLRFHFNRSGKRAWKNITDTIRIQFNLPCTVH